MTSALALQLAVLMAVAAVAYFGGKRDGRASERRRWFVMLRLLNQTISPHHEFRSRVMRHAHSIEDDGWNANIVERDERGRRAP